jgi:hypothetical protein
MATYTGTISDSDLQGTVAASPGDGRSGPNIAVLHFYGATTGYAGSGPTGDPGPAITAPEPSTIIAALMGLVPLGVVGLRRLLHRSTAAAA